MRPEQQSPGLPGPHPPITDAYPNTTEWVSPLSSSYGLLQEGGGEKGAVYVTLIDEVNTAGVHRDKDNNSICGSGGGLKSPVQRHVLSLNIFVCLFCSFCVKKAGKIEKESCSSVFGTFKFLLHQGEVIFCHH